MYCGVQDDKHRRHVTREDDDDLDDVWDVC
jgi:hypothetical protein